MNKNIMIAGDVMVDEYWHGDSTRISPESPVPVVDNIRVSRALGGAANVALNVRQFVENTAVYGCVGYDENNDHLIRMLSQANISYRFSYHLNDKTINKIRVVSNNQQICRVDDGVISSHPPLIDDINNIPDVIIVSDYGKGTLSEAYIEYLIDFDVPVIIDPKGTDWSKYHGAFCITPNKKEFEEAYGEFTPERAFEVVQELDLTGILITLGADGMHWVSDEGSIYIPTEAQEVIDVTGAGDTVIATFASFLHEGIEPAMRKANKAAGIVVGRFGTCAPKESEIVEKVVFTNGCFDIVHSGHIALLKEAAKLGDRLVVGLNSDASVERIKRKPINDQIERKAVLRGIEGVDDVVVFDEDTPEQLISSLKPSIIVKGGDYTVETVVGHDIVEEVVIFPLLEGKSTTNVIKRIKDVE